MGAKKKRAKFKLLSQGRPPNFKPVRSISSKATRTLIRSHHTLEKQKAKALAVGDDAKAEAFAKQIESQGGIELYQQASLVGQAADRGGDSSKVGQSGFLNPVCYALRFFWEFKCASDNSVAFLTEHDFSSTRFQLFSCLLN